MKMLTCTAASGEPGMEKIDYEDWLSMAHLYNNCVTAITRSPELYDPARIQAVAAMGKIVKEVESVYEQMEMAMMAPYIWRGIDADKF